MKSITRLSLALIMFSLFSISYLVTSVSADMYNPPPNPSNDPRNTMKSESVDLNKQTLQLHKRITELEQQLNEERAKGDKNTVAVACFRSSQEGKSASLVKAMLDHFRQLRDDNHSGDYGIVFGESGDELRGARYAIDVYQANLSDCYK